MKSTPPEGVSVPVSKGVGNVTCAESVVSVGDIARLVTLLTCLSGRWCLTCSCVSLIIAKQINFS